MTTPEPKPTPPQFLDGEAHAWHIVLDFATLHRIRDVAQVDLGNIERLAETWAGLLYEDEKALLAVWCAIEPAATANGVSREQFSGSMNGELLQAALDALSEAVVSFTQPRKRGMAAKAIQGVASGMQAAIAQAETSIQTAIETKTQEALAVLGT